MKMSGWLAVVAVALSCSSGVAAEVALPAGWRRASGEEHARMLEIARRQGGAVDQKLSVRADFDGDRREDEAALLLNDSTGRFALFVRRASVGRFEELAAGGEIADLWNHTLGVIRPGRHEPACARGLGSAGAPCRKLVRNRWPAIDFISVEASSEMLFWNGQAFESEFLSD